MSEDFNDFRRRVLKVSEKRNHRIKNSIGVKNAFFWCRKNQTFKNFAVTEKEFYSTVRAVNNLLAKELLKGKDVMFPQKMGQLEVRKYSIYVKLVDGKLHTNRKINWKATLELWNSDEEARADKILVRNEDKEHFKIFYNKVIANYPNKTLMQFKPNRELLIAINKLAKEGLLDAYKIGL